LTVSIFLTNMLKSTEKGSYYIQLPRFMKDLFLDIVEEVLNNNFHYECTKTSHLIKTLGDKRRIPKSQYYLITKESSYDPKKNHYTSSVISRDFAIRFYPVEIFGEDDLEHMPIIEIVPLRKKYKISEELVNVIDGKIKEKNEIFIKNLRLGTIRL